MHIDITDILAKARYVDDPNILVLPNDDHQR